MRTIEVTVAATRTQVTAARIKTPFVIFQNNGSADMRLGDNTVTSSTGIKISSGGSVTVQRADNGVLLSQYYVIGTASDKLDILYE